MAKADPEDNRDLIYRILQESDDEDEDEIDSIILNSGTYTINTGSKLLLMIGYN